MPKDSETVAQSAPPKVDARTTNCTRCSKPFRYLPVLIFGNETGIVPSLCDPCDSDVVAEGKLKAADAAARMKFNQAESRRLAWLDMCPPRFQETDLNHRAMRGPEARQALAWKYESKGVLMVGETDSGKSRILWEICRRSYVNDGLSVQVYGATDFAFQLTKSFSDGNDRYCALIERLREVDILALDDLGKERMTDRVQSELFGLVDWRMNYGRPLVITTNYVRQAFAKRFTDADTAVPLIRRLVDSCHNINIPALRS